MRVKLESFLKETCEKTTKNNQYPVLTASKAGLFLQSDYFNKQVASKDNTGYKIIYRGQFTYRAMSDTGEFFPNMLECANVGIVSPAYPIFEITKPNEILPDYLKYYFKSDSFQHSISAFAQGSTRTSVKFNKMKTVSIDLPSVSKQKEIVSCLSKVNVITEYTHKQLQKLDELVKSRFIELFGDPEQNDKEWIVRSLGEICSVGSSKRIYQSEQSTSGVPFLRISDLVNKMDAGSFDSDLFIPERKYIELQQAKLVPVPGDILVTSRGTLGRCYIIKNEDRFYFQDGMISWLSNYSNGISPLYLQYLFDMPSFRKQIDCMQAGSTVAYLSIAMLKKLRVMIPDEDVLERFTAFVEQVDKSKLVALKYININNPKSDKNRRIRNEL